MKILSLSYLLRKKKGFRYIPSYTVGIVSESFCSLSKLDMLLKWLCLTICESDNYIYFILF